MLEDVRLDVRMLAAQNSIDRERARRVEAGIGRALDHIMDRPAQTPAPRQRPKSATWSGCPCMGLTTFQESDAAVFFGRHALTRRLVDRLGEHLSTPGIIVVLGPSGAGESSLLRAGLLPALAEDQLVAGSSSWPRRVMTPTDDPVGQLAAHLADLLGIAAPDVHKSLASTPDDAHLFLRQLHASSGPSG